eukprot:snap_masked-scaffold_5-processed-gene-7.16-mRNA-1 protein AED:0.01 eAED:0.03 QI:0/0/0/1/1/1/2/0/601
MVHYHFESILIYYTSMRAPGVCLVKKEYALRNFVADPIESTSTNEENNKTPRKRKFRHKNRGQNKTRSLEELGLNKRPNKKDILCQSIAKDKPCSKHVEDCPFSHDLLTFLQTKQADPTFVADLPIKSCPQFLKTGVCSFGHRCLFSQSHTILDATNRAKNSINNEVNEKYKEKITEKEVYEEIKPQSDFLFSLRRKQYDFGADIDFSAEKTSRKLDLTDKIYIAPLTTVGNLPFRRICKKFGADVTCGEMCLARELLTGKASEWALTRRHSSEDVFGVQITDSDPKILLKTVNLFNSGQNENLKLDFVDFNLGCPIDLITGYGAGSALMNREGKITTLVQSLEKVKRLSFSYGIKMRTGWNSSKHTAHKLIRKVSNFTPMKLAYFAVHGRSRQQRYTKLSDWNCRESIAIEKENGNEETILEPLNINLIGNGDIMSHIDWSNKVRSNPSVTTGMIARGALIKPWISKEIKEEQYFDISAQERFDLLTDFCRFGLEHWGSDRKGVDTTRRFLLEWMSFLWRYIPVGVIEQNYLPQMINDRPQRFIGRNDLETILGSPAVEDWITVTERILGKVPKKFKFVPKHRANAYQPTTNELLKEVKV